MAVGGIERALNGVQLGKTDVTVYEFEIARSQKLEILYASCMASKDDTIAELRVLVEEQAKQIVALTQEVAELKLKLAKANKDSSNSSKSPSSDITGAGKDKKKYKPGRPKKRKIGGQPGRRRNLREPLPPERVDESFEYEIDPNEVCRLQLTPTGEFDTVQTIELPNAPVVVTEHRFAL